MDKNASFPGGDESLVNYLAKTVRYPKQAIDSGIQGTVYLVFVINQDSTVSDVRTLNTQIGYGIEEEALRAIKSTSGMWYPAVSRDRLVRMRYRVPIKFRIY